MPQTSERPPPGGRGGLENTSCAASVNGSSIAPRNATAQEEISADRRARPNLRLVPPAVPSRQRRVDVRISASGGRAIGRSRAFRLSDHDLGALIVLAVRGRAMSAMTKCERDDLYRLIRQREKVLKSAAKQRSAAVLADFEN